MKKTLMVIGIGDLAGLFVDIISRNNQIGKIIIASRNTEVATQRKNLAILAAAQLGFYPDISVINLDLNNIMQSAAVLHKYQPDIIFNTATLQSWRIITLLPKEIFKQLDEAQFGPWLPMHLTLMYQLMQAVTLAKIKTKVVNAAFPDAVGACLKTQNFAPYIGIGNVANVIPALRGAVAVALGASLKDVSVALFSQHYFTHRIPTFGDSGGCPYNFTAYLNGQDVTADLDLAKIISMVTTHFVKTGGAFRQLITATSAASVILAMLNPKETIVHAPAPGGLVGGYRVKLSQDKLALFLPPSLSLEQAVHINEAGQVFDGISKITSDSVVHFAPPQMAVMKKMLNYECNQMQVTDTAFWASELTAKFKEFCHKGNYKLT